MPEALLLDKTLKAKEKTLALSGLLLQKKLSPDELTDYAAKAKDPIKATCIEALEYATTKDPALLTQKAFRFVCRELGAKAPRVKWESARVIANTAHLFPSELGDAVKGLLINSEDDGTVVRWSAAQGLCAIFQVDSSYKKKLRGVIEAIISREEQNSIRKIYLATLKKEDRKK